MGPRTHAAWLGSTVFDGARAFEGVAPDLDRHCARVNQSAVNFKLKPVVDTETWLGLAREGIARFDANAELYIRPMYWAADRQRRRRAVRSRNHQLVPVHLCGADAAADRQRHHAVAVPPADHGKRAGRLQGGLPLSEQFARADRSAGARLQQLPDARHARQCRGIRQFERVHGEGRRGLHAGAERHVPQRHHAAAGDRSVARRRRHRGRDDPEISRISRAPTKSSPAAISPRSRRSSGSTTARCSRGRSTAARASCTGILPTPERRPGKAKRQGPYSTSSVSVRSARRGRCGPLKYLRPRALEKMPARPGTGPLASRMTEILPCRISARPIAPAHCDEVGDVAAIDQLHRRRRDPAAADAHRQQDEWKRAAAGACGIPG